MYQRVRSVMRGRFDNRGPAAAGRGGLAARLPGRLARGGLAACLLSRPAHRARNLIGPEPDDDLYGVRGRQHHGGRAQGFEGRLIDERLILYA